MLPPDDPRIAIDLEIFVLEKQIVDLKRRRNTFALTSRLPPEVISRVFVAGLSFDIHDVSPHDIDGQKKATISAADYFTPCHVCHSWRAIALRSPDMWSLLRLSSGASASLVDFMWNNSKCLPVSLSVWDESQAAAKDATAIASLLQSGLHRLHALIIYMERHSMKALLDSVMGRAGEMQSLTIVGQSGGSTLPVPGNPRIFSNGTPKLRRLHLQNYVLPWATPIFASPHLTHLEIHSTPQPTTNSMAELITLLRKLPSLEHLHLTIGLLLNRELLSVAAMEQVQVEMPNLTYICLDSINVEPLSMILHAIRIPSESTTVELRYAIDAPSKPLLQELYTACRHAFTGSVAPVALSFSQDAAGKEHQIHALKPADGADPFIATPWIKLATGITPGRERARNAHPFSNPALTPLMWSYANLRFLEAWIHFAMPQAGWDDLARAPLLEYIVITAACTFFVDCLRGRTPENQKPTTNRRKPQEFIDSLSNRVRFPALNTLIFVNVGSIISYRGRTKNDPHPAPGWLKDIVEALCMRAGAKLQRLEFSEVGEYQYTGEWGVKTDLSSVTEASWWGDEAVELQTRD